MLVHIRRVAAAAELKGFKISHTVENHEMFTGIWKLWKDNQPQKLSHEPSHITAQKSREGNNTQQRRKEKKKNFLIFLYLSRLLFIELVICHSAELKPVLDEDAFK